MQMSVKRFDFGGLQDFKSPPPPIEIVADNTLQEVEELAPPPPPSFSEEELTTAKAEAWEEGRRAGVKEESERQETEAKRRQQSIEQACTSIAQQALNLAQTHQLFMQKQTEELATLVIMLARKVAGDAVNHLPEGSIEAMLDQCLPVLQQQPKVILFVHPNVRDSMEEKLNALIAHYHFETAITVKVKDGLAPGEARLEWQDGSAERRLDDIWAQIQEIIEHIDFTQLVQASANVDLSQAPQPTQAELQQAQEEAAPLANEPTNTQTEGNDKGEQA